MDTRIYQFHLLQAIRNFFNQKGFMDVMTPPLVQNPGMEVHIHPFRAQRAKSLDQTDLYLHTSPEFAMKELLSHKEYNDIFTLTYSFRDEPHSPIHREQFIMLEWYRKNEFYEKIMDDIEELITYTQAYLKEKNVPSQMEIKEFPRVTVSELFQEYLEFEILDFLDTNELQKKIKLDFKDIPLPSVQCDWDDYYFLLFLNKIEPMLTSYPYLLIKEFPAPLSALSTISKKDKRVCERFEVYMSGVELCNCFNELTNISEQKIRFNQQARDKKRLYNYSVPEPSDFYESLERGLPKSSGVALGVERLLSALSGINNPFFK